ncbi:hypothetical protein [Serratia entomophila]|uniref:hypothetical protein n=1 Tax=Serratia entomophila TaxID=42906 RepID=UPI00217AD4B8|nr:hypothetical protein [Serratia entomophila]CAI1573108.1 Uncharacterised protein [Serratia entomophila]CAI1662690.1 Uncharacterised protein [Serratia entomophila]
MMNDHKVPNNIARRTLSALLLACGGLCFPAGAAQEWQFTASPYLWGAGIRGDVGHRATGTQFMKTDFSDIVRNLDVALMGMGEARNGPYSLLVDLMFIDTTTRNSLPAGAPASRLKVDNRTVSGFLGGGYTLLEGEKGRLDATAGIRVWYSSTSLSFQGGNADGIGGSDRATWADGVAGLRGHYALAPSIWVSAWGLAGGGQSRLDWDAAALMGWEFMPGFSAVAGYRAMGVDYRHNGFVYDVVQQGPILGMRGRF